MKLKRIILITIILIAIAIPYNFIFKEPLIREAGAWWNSNWQYYRLININNNGYSGYYQMLINVTYSGSDDTSSTPPKISLNSHCQSDFDDIRFVCIDNSTTLPYWIEEKVDGSYALVWVNVSATAMSDGKILIYYGNPSATSESNGNSTFIFFDNFQGTTLDTNKWNVYSGTYGAYTVNNKLTLYANGTISSGAFIHIYSKVKQPVDTVIWEIRYANRTDYADINLATCIDAPSSGGDWGYYNAYRFAFWCYSTSSRIKIIKNVNGAGSDVTYITSTPPISGILGGWWQSNYLKLFINRSSAPTISGTDTSHSNQQSYFDIGLTVSGSTPRNVAMEVYYALIRNYTSTPPSFSSFGSEQTQTVTIIIECYPTTWTISENPKTGMDVYTSYDYFTVWNNGTSSVTVKIAINNSANWIYCNWTTYSTTTNLNYFTCNFTLDGTTWTNIEPKVSGEPVTTLFTLTKGSSNTFGLKLWIPRYLSTTAQQQFEVYLKAYE